MKSSRRPLSPCPLGTSCPGQLVALIPRVHLLLGWMASLGRWASSHMPFSIFALRLTLRGILSLLSCGFAFPAFISFLLFPDGRFPLSAVGLRDRRASRGSCSLSSCSLPQRNWRCWSDAEFDHQKIHPRLVKSPHLWDRTLHPGSRSLQLKISLRTGKETTPP